MNSIKMKWGQMFEEFEANKKSYHEYQEELSWVSRRVIMSIKKLMKWNFVVSLRGSKTCLLCKVIGEWNVENDKRLPIRRCLSKQNVI